jgi:hypothetical protein
MQRSWPQDAVVAYAISFAALELRPTTFGLPPKGEMTALRTVSPYALIAMQRLNIITMSIQEDESFQKASFGNTATHGSQKLKN